MTSKEFIGKLSFRLVRFALFLARIMPVSMTYGLCNLLSRIGILLNWKRKKIALRNLVIVFPDKPLNSIKKIFHVSLKNMLKNYFEIAVIKGKKYTREKILSMCDAEGLDYLNKIVEREQGALLFSGHFGNFPLMMLWLAQKGYPVAAIYKEANNFPEDYFADIMRRYDLLPLKYTSDASLTVSIIRAIKQNYIVLIQNDQSVEDGVYIKFFNKWVPSAAGPTILAKRTGVPVIPGLIYRQKNNRHKIIISPEFRLISDEDTNEFIKKNIQMMANWVAKTIVEYPSEWLWLHNRWKREKKDPQQDL